MALFTKDELVLIDALAAGKRPKDTDAETLESVKEKLDVTTQSQIPDRFVSLTGWTNPAKDYPA